MNKVLDNRENDLYRINIVLEQNGIYTNELEEDVDMGLDSLTIVSILVCLENEFAFAFPDEELLSIPQTYNGFVNFVMKNLEQYFANSEPNVTCFMEGGD